MALRGQISSLPRGGGIESWFTMNQVPWVYWPCGCLIYPFGSSGHPPLWAETVLAVASLWSTAVILVPPFHVDAPARGSYPSSGFRISMSECLPDSVFSEKVQHDPEEPAVLDVGGDEPEPDTAPPGSQWVPREGSTRARVFLSYSSSQRGLAERIAVALRSEDYEVFFDRHTLMPGDAFHAKIRAEIRRADLMVFLISQQSVATDCYARTELRIAEREWQSPAGRVIPVMAEPTLMDDVPAFLREVQMVAAGHNVIAEVAYASNGWCRPRPNSRRRTRGERGDGPPPGSVAARLESAYQHREELLIAGRTPRRLTARYWIYAENNAAANAEL